MSEDRTILTLPGFPPDNIVRYGTNQAHIAEVWNGRELASGRPLVALIHGGFWRPEYTRSHLRPMAAELRREGWTVCSIEYRRRPGCPVETVEDVLTALNELPALISAPQNGSVLIIGHSAGGHLALLAAGRAQCPLTGTLALAPVADLRRAHHLGIGNGAVGAFLGTTPENHPDLDPARLPAPESPVTIVHGDDDEIVPADVATGSLENARIVRLPDTGHFALIDPRSAPWQVIVAEINKLATTRTISLPASSLPLKKSAR